jgi:hypothetical protein
MCISSPPCMPHALPILFLISSPRYYLDNISFTTFQYVSITYLHMQWAKTQWNIKNLYEEGHAFTLYSYLPNFSNCLHSLCNHFSPYTSDLSNNATNNLAETCGSSWTIIAFVIYKLVYFVGFIIIHFTRPLPLCPPAPLTDGLLRILNTEVCTFRIVNRHRVMECG